MRAAVSFGEWKLLAGFDKICRILSPNRRRSGAEAAIVTRREIQDDSTRPLRGFAVDVDPSESAELLFRGAVDGESVFP
jgi:hypothetical protein